MVMLLGGTPMLTGGGLRIMPPSGGGGGTADLLTLLPNSNHRVKRNGMVQNHFPSSPPAGFEGDWRGTTDTTGFTVKTVTTADQLATEMNNATPSQKLHIKCQWNGNSQSAQRMFGYSSSSLTANGSIDWGYDRPTGEILIEPDTGYSPIYESTYNSGVIDMLGFSKVTIQNMTFENPSLWFTSNSSYPCIAMVALLNNTFQNGTGTSTSTYGAVKFIGSRTIHATGNAFNDCNAVFIGSANYFRSWDNTISGIGDNDVHGMRGFNQSYETNWWANIWVAGNILYNTSSRNASSGLHPDFVQIGDTTDGHIGYSVLGEMNVFHLDRGGTMQGTQGFFGAVATGRDGDWLVHNNIGMISAYHAASLHDPNDNMDKVATKNLFLRSATPNATQDSYPWIEGSRIATGTGTFEVSDNYAAAYNTGNVSGETFTSNDTVDPRTSAVSPNRYVDVITGNGSFGTDATSGFLTYTSPDAGAASPSAAKTAIANFAKPLAGWAVNSGPEDPSTWPTGDYSAL